jgi:hypothetical protein
MFMCLASVILIITRCKFILSSSKGTLVPQQVYSSYFISSKLILLHLREKITFIFNSIIYQFSSFGE